MPSSTTIQVKMLDDSINSYEVKPSSCGSVLLQAIMKDLDVLESDYFGASYDNGDGLTFLDPLREIGRQIKKLESTVLSFGVKFFTPDPSQMQDEYTRYLFALQIKRDVNNGTLQCAENTALEIASYIVQAEFGDWNAAECSDGSYLNDMKIFPNPSPQHLQKISQLHRNLIGKKPDEADYSLLDVARRLEMYGVRLYPALDAQNAEIKLGVSHAGVTVFQGIKRINNFNWSRMRKMSFKRKRFLLKLLNDPVQPSGRKGYGNILVFVMKSRDACKNFWKLCIEHHAFFRLEVRPKMKPKPVLLSRGSSFHYNGKTQKELLELVRNSNFRRTNFVRTTSRRRTHHYAPTQASAVNEAKNSKPELNLQDMTITQNNTTNSNVTTPSSSTYTEDQGSYRVNDSSFRSPDTEASVTTADITPDSNQKSVMPEWQMESKSLHSSATPIGEQENVQEVTEVKGKISHLSNFRKYEHMNGERNDDEPDSTPLTNNDKSTFNSNLSYRERMRILYKNSRKNDSNVPSVEALLRDVTAGDQSNPNTNISNNNDSFFVAKKSLSFDPLNSYTTLNSGPPLPPKERQLSHEREGSYDNLNEIDIDREHKTKLDDEYVSSSGFKGMGDSKDPFVNDSVVNLAAVDTPMTPEIKVRIGEQKIKTGHYSVPKKPPTPPDGESFNSPRWNRTSQILDKDINEAMTQLYKAINEANDYNNKKQTDEKEEVCVDGSEAIVVSSSEDEEGKEYDIENGIEVNVPLSPEDDPLLAPIKMEFDDTDSVILTSL